MIICRITENEYLQVVYLDDMASRIDSLQVRVSLKEIPFIEDFLYKALKRIETSTNTVDAETITEGPYSICLYPAVHKAIITLRGETIKLHFDTISELKNKLASLAQ